MTPAWLAGGLVWCVVLLWLWTWVYRPQLLGRLVPAGLLLRHRPPEAAEPPSGAVSAAQGHEHCPPERLPAALPAPIAGPPLAGLNDLLQACILVPRALLQDLDPISLRLYMAMQAGEGRRDGGERRPYLGGLTALSRDWPRTDADARAGKPGVAPRTLELRRDLLVARGALRREEVLLDGRTVVAYLTVLPGEFEPVDDRQVMLPGTLNASHPRSGAPQIGSGDLGRISSDLGRRSGAPQIGSGDLGRISSDLEIASVVGSTEHVVGGLGPLRAIDVDVDRRRDRIDRIDVDGAGAPPPAPAGPSAKTSDTLNPNAADPFTGRADKAAPAVASAEHDAVQQNAAPQRGASETEPELTPQQVVRRKKAQEKRVECDRRRLAEFLLYTPEGAARYPQEARRLGVVTVSAAEAEELGGFKEHDKSIPSHPMIGWLFSSEEMCRRAGRKKPPPPPDQLDLDLAAAIEDACEPEPEPIPRWILVRERLLPRMTEVEAALWLPLLRAEVTAEGLRLTTEKRVTFTWFSQYLQEAERLLQTLDSTMRLELQCAEEEVHEDGR